MTRSTHYTLDGQLRQRLSQRVFAVDAADVRAKDVDAKADGVR